MKSQLARRVAASTIATAISLVLALQPASAAPTRFSGTGTVTRVLPFTSAPTGAVATGDSVTFSFTFDPARGSRFIDNGTALQVFAVPYSDITVNVGDFALLANSTPALPAGIALATGFGFVPGNTNGGTRPILNQQFALPGFATGNLPFATGSDGRVVFSVFSTFAYPAPFVVPTLADLRDPRGSFNNRFQLAVVGGNNRTVGIVEGTYTVGAFAAVPEPSAWALLILGFAIVGAGMRTRRYSRRVPSAL